MKLNQNTYIVGQNITLVPYSSTHVPKYHSWMQQKELREATGSEALNLAQEYTMQQSWSEDEDKCTFIIMDKSILQSTKDETRAMLGDVNLYLREEHGQKIAEVGIMIAEKHGRRQGKGFEALCHMLNYGINFIDVKKFEAKIGFTNTPSINLFKKAGFQLVNRSEAFQEATFNIDVTKEWKDWLTNTTENAKTLL